MSSAIIGSRDSPVLKAKAARTKALLPWIVQLLGLQGGTAMIDATSLGREGSSLLDCSVSFAHIYGRCSSQPHRLSTISLQYLREESINCAAAWQRSGRPGTMKWHVLAEHLCSQMEFAGNMTWTHNYMDDGR
mgnify:CR=1 FL=1